MRISTDTPQFFLTAPAPCPYLDGRMERKVFTHLVGDRADQMNDILTQGGFRRSQNIAYRPACEGCRSCISIRVRVDDFVMKKRFKRVLHQNRGIVGEAIEPQPTSEQYDLFRTYLDARHAKGGMADMSVMDYTMMVQDTHVSTFMIEYRARSTDTALLGRGEGPLLACALTDTMSDGLSMVYSFYDPAITGQSLGTYIILDHIERAMNLGLPYVYLGYWVEGSPKMDYKTDFQPQEHLGPNGWRDYEG